MIIYGPAASLRGPSPSMCPPIPQNSGFSLIRPPATDRWQRGGMHGRGAPSVPAGYMQLSHHLDAGCEQPACSLHAVCVQLAGSLYAAFIRPTRNLYEIAMVNIQIRRMLLALCNTQDIKNSFKIQRNSMLLLICLKTTSRSVPQGGAGITDRYLT